MVVARRLRVYREVFAVLASVIFALALLHRRPALVAAHPADDRALPAPPSPTSSASAGDGAAVVEPTTVTSAAATASSSAPPERRPERILVIGDSMVEVLAPTLAAYAIENGHTFVPAIWYGSTTAAWARSPKLDSLLREIDPTVVLVVLGSSELTSRNIDSRGPFVRTIIDRIGSRKVGWIGPPNWRADSGINDLLAREVGADRFFRSADLELTRKRDGIHPDADGGRAWMHAIADWLSHESACALAMQPPSRSAKAPPARVLGTM